MTTNFPAPNLPNEAMPWARDVVKKLQQLEKDAARTDSSVTSDNRAIAGQMGAVGRQIEELGSRVTHIVTLASVTVTASSVKSFSSATVSGTIPGVGSARNALISV